MTGLAARSAALRARRPSIALARFDARLLAAGGVVILAYVIAARGWLAMGVVAGAPFSAWSAAGIAVFAVLVEPALWPAVFAGSLLASLAAGSAPAVAPLVATGATIEAIVAVALLRRARFRPQLDRPVDVLTLGVLGAAIPAALAATLGMVLGDVLAPARSAGAPVAWVTWWLGDTLRILVVVGVLGTWTASRARARLRDLAEPAFWLMATAAASIVLFFDVLDLRAEGQSVAFPIIPLVILVAFRVGPRWNAAAALVYSVIALVATELGRGPFVGASAEASLLYVGGFIALAWMTGAAVAAAIAQRETALRELETANQAARDALARLDAVETIGHSLAEAGPTPEALDTVVGLMSDVFGYEFPSIYVGDERHVRLGAHRGYDAPTVELDGTRGVVGRAMRSTHAVVVADVRADPDFIRVDDAVVSEVAVPLRSSGRLLGIVNVESRRSLGDADVASITVVADRIAAALALALEREALADRAAMFRRLIDYSARISSVLAVSDLDGVVVSALGSVVPADLVGLTLADAGGRYVVRGEKGSSGAIGQTVEPGEGASGRAIAERRLIRIADHPRERFPSAVRSNADADGYSEVIAVPLLREEAVLGSLTVGRVDGSFTDLEREVLELLGHEVALAVANARSHAEVAELATHDALTGLHNRRYFDGALGQLLARHRRLAKAKRAPLSAVLFDLDRFGDFNVQHGHQIGDEVLRAFAALLRARVRGSDLVARYGGEEFIAVLPGATRDDAVGIADGIRQALAATSVRGIDGRSLRVTVSAGVTEVGDGDLEADAIIRAADVGLLMAKRSGRDQVVAA